MPHDLLELRRRPRGRARLVSLIAGAALLLGASTFMLWPEGRDSKHTLSFADASRILADPYEHEMRRIAAAGQLGKALHSGLKYLSAQQRARLRLVAAGELLVLARPMTVDEWKEGVDPDLVAAELEAALACHHAARWTAPPDLRGNLATQARHFASWLRD